MKNFTKPQIEAIQKEGSNILINAGAGSGKTTVLTQRIINKLLRGTKINEILVLTFTNAAARQMKERIIKEAKKHEQLKDQIPLINISDITTFDGYMLNFLKTYGYILNIDKNIKIGDDVILEKELDEIIVDVFEQYYIKLQTILKTQKDYDKTLLKIKKEKELDEVEAFLLLVQEYMIFDDNTLKENFKDLYYKYISVLDKQKLKISQENKFIDQMFLEYEKSIFDNILQIKKLNESLNLYKIDKNTITSIEKYQDKVSKISYITDYDDLVDTILDFSMPSKTTSKKEEFEKVKEIQGSIKKLYDNLKKDLILKPKQDIINQEYNKKPLKKLIFNMLDTINENYLEVKKSSNNFNFFDITNYSLEILKSHSFIREELKFKYNEILIDEYQDTNDFQNEFISLIENNNLYLVGDVKQSIYGFRNANPQNFQKLENEYKQDFTKGHVINLLHNFRSREEVLDSVNQIFQRLMHKNIGHIDYSDNHALLYGNKSYEVKSKVNYMMEMIEYEKEIFKGFSSSDIEAFIIAKDITQKIQEGYEVLKEGRLVKCSYKDFCILTKNKTQYSNFKDVFDYFGIPVNVQKEELINNQENYELLVILNILKLIVNKHEKASLVSILRSFLYRTKEQDIYDYLHFDKTCSEVQNIYSNIDYIKKGDFKNLNILLKVIYNKFNFFEHVVYLDNISNLNDRFLKIDLVAKELVENGKGIDDFIEYLEYMFLENKKDFELTSKPVSSNCVEVMTIHKSKGLEFKIVYVAQMSTALFKPEKNLISLNNDTLNIPFINNYVREDSFLKTVFKDKEVKANINENIRLLYVAMTRAQEKVIFVNKKLNHIDAYDLINIKKFENLLSSFGQEIKKIKVLEEEVEKFDYQGYKDFKLEGRVKKIIPKTSNYFQYEKIDSKLMFKQTKVSSKKIDELLSTKEKAQVSLGIEIHKYLERFNFLKLLDSEYVSKYIDEVGSKHKDMLANIIDNFKKYDIFKNIKLVHNEYSFYYEDKKEQVNGVVDLLLETDQYVYIIDYKLKDINKEEYKRQLKMYKKALEIYFDKEIKCYLYSLIEDKVKEVVC